MICLYKLRDIIILGSLVVVAKAPLRCNSFHIRSLSSFLLSLVAKAPRWILLAFFY